MIFVYLIPVYLSCLFLAAHFYRSGMFLFTLISLALPWFLFLGRKWVSRTAQIFLLLGGFEWLRTMVTLIAERKMKEQSYTGIVIILGSVALFTVLSALVFRVAAVKKYYSKISSSE